MTCHCDGRGAGRPIGDLTNVGEDFGKVAKVEGDAAIGTAAGGAIGGAVAGPVGGVVGGDVGYWGGTVYGVADQFGGDILNAVSDVGSFFGLGGGPKGPPPSTFDTSGGYADANATLSPPSDPTEYWGDDGHGNPLRPLISFRLSPGYQRGPHGVGQVPIPPPPISQALRVLRTAHLFSATQVAPSTAKILSAGALAVHLPTAVATAAPTIAHVAAVAQNVKASPPSAPASTAKKIAIGGGVLGTLATVAALTLRFLK